MFSRHKTDLHRRLVIPALHQLRGAARIFQKSLHLPSVRIVSHHADEGGPAPQSAQIGHHVPRAAQHARLPVHPHDGNGSLRRNPGDAAVQKLVQHHVPDAENAHLGKSINQCMQPVHGDVSFYHAPPDKARTVENRRETGKKAKSPSPRTACGISLPPPDRKKWVSHDKNLDLQAGKHYLLSPVPGRIEKGK